MKMVRSPSFLRDLQSITDYFIEAKEEKTARRFAKELDDTIDFIVRFPDLGSPWESSDAELAELRYRPVKKFKRHLVVYRRLKTRLVILRVIHASRNVEELLRE
jgi:toxin ParE1/3/4